MIINKLHVYVNEATWCNSRRGHQGRHGTGRRIIGDEEEVCVLFDNQNVGNSSGMRASPS